MKRLKIFKKLRKLINDNYSVEKEKITMSLKIKEDLNFDSLERLEMLHFVEKQFNIYIQERELIKLRTVRDIVTIIKNKSE
jgi:acyl carrier protein